MNEVRIHISLTPATQELCYNAYLSDKALAAKIKSLQADGMTYRIVNMYDGEILFSNR